MAQLYARVAGAWVPIGGGGIDQATADARYVNVAGDTMTAPLVLAADPAAALQAATKQYVDAKSLPSTWTAFTFTNGWGNIGASFQTCQYRKIGDMVYVRGVAKATTLSGDWSFCTMPAGFRPPATLIFNRFGNDAPLRIDVSSDGRIVPSNAAIGASGTWYSYVNLDLAWSTVT